MIYRLAVFFSLLPNFGIAFLPSDTQPFAFLFSLLGLFFIKQNTYVFNKVSLPFVLMALLATISAVISIVMGLHSVIDLARYYFGYISAPVIICYLVFKMKKEDPSILVNICDFVLVFVVFGMFLQFIGASSLINPFVNRAVFVDITESARGYTSFFSEQSRVPIQMTIILGVYLLTDTATWKRMSILLIISALSFSGQFVIMLGIVCLAFLLSHLYYAIKKLSFSIKHLKWALLIMILPLLFLNENVIKFLDNIGLPVMGFSRALSLVTAGFDYIANDRGILVKLSGVFYAACSLLATPFSFLIGAAGVESRIDLFFDTYRELSFKIFGNDFVYTGKNVFSAFGTWIVDFGLIGLLNFLIVQLLLIKNIVFTRQYNKGLLLTYIIWLIMTIFPSALANPSLWFLLSLIIVSSRGDFSLNLHATNIRQTLYKQR